MLVAAVRLNRPRLWLFYALALMLSILLSINMILLVPVYALMLWLLAPRKFPQVSGRLVGRHLGRRIGLMTPFIVFAHGQVFQVNWLFPVSWHYAFDIVQRQYFDHSVPFAVLTAVLIVAAIVARLSAWQPRRARRAASCSSAQPGSSFPPPSSSSTRPSTNPLYFPRYLILTAPAAAIVMAVCIVTVARRPWPIAAVVLLFAVAAVPGYLFTQRWPYAKEGWDYSQVADLISSHATPGDCVMVDNTVVWKPGPIRALLATRPAAFRSLIDVGRGVYGPKVGSLWDGHVAVWLVTAKINKCTTIWTVTDHDKSLPDHQTGPIVAAGIRIRARAGVPIPELPRVPHRRAVAVPLLAGR